MNEHIARHAPESGSETSTADLKAYFNVSVDNKFLILAVAFLVGIAGLLYAFNSKPVFETNMTILIEETSPNAAKNVLSEASSLFETKKTTVAEMELLRSRRVIAPVVDTLGLAVEVQPRYFPVVGAAISAARAGQLSEPGWLGRGGYVWGGERLDVSSFNAAGALAQRTFVLTALGGNSYRLSDDANSFQWNGRVGAPLRGNIGALGLELQVARLHARPGAQFLLRSVSKQAVVAGIQGALQVAEQGKQSGLIELRLQGDRADTVRATLDEIGREYLRQSVARRREDAEKALSFVDAQTLALRAQLDQSDAQYSRLRHRHGTVNLADEARVGVEQAAAAKAKRAELQQRKVELLTRYGNRHPLVVAVNDQLAEMDLAAQVAGNEFKTLPTLEKDELRITRDNKVKSELYAALSHTAQQLRILAASKTSNVRLVDPPTLPEGPIKPNRSLIVSAAVMLGLLLGLVAAFVKRAVWARFARPKAGRETPSTILRAS